MKLLINVDIVGFIVRFNCKSNTDNIPPSLHPLPPSWNRCTVQMIWHECKLSKLVSCRWLNWDGGCNEIGRISLSSCSTHTNTGCAAQIFVLSYNVLYNWIYQKWTTIVLWCPPTQWEGGLRKDVLHRQKLPSMPKRNFEISALCSCCFNLYPLSPFIVRWF